MPRVSYACSRCGVFFHLLLSAHGYYSRYSGAHAGERHVLSVTSAGRLAVQTSRSTAVDVELNGTGPEKSLRTGTRNVLNKVKRNVESSLLGVEHHLKRTRSRRSNRARRVKSARRNRIQTRPMHREAMMRRHVRLGTGLSAGEPGHEDEDPDEDHAHDPHEGHPHGHDAGHEVSGKKVSNNTDKGEHEPDEPDAEVWKMTYMEKLELEVGWILECVIISTVLTLLCFFWPYNYIGRQYKEEEFLREKAYYKSQQMPRRGAAQCIYETMWGQNTGSYFVNLIIIFGSLWNFTMFCLQTEVKYFPQEEKFGIALKPWVQPANFWSQVATMIVFFLFIILRVVGSAAHPFWENFGGAAPGMFLVGDFYTHVEILALVPSLVDLVSGEDYCMNLTWISIIRTAEMMSRQQSTGAVLRKMEELGEHSSLILMLFAIGLIVWIAMGGMYFVANRDNAESVWKAARYEVDPADKHWQRFSSIPSSMWFALLNLSCEDPIADVHNTFIERICVVLACMVGVPLFALPTGVFGGILTEQAKSQIEDSEEDEEDKIHENKLQNVHWAIPLAVTSISILSVWTYMFWTASHVPHTGSKEPFRLLWIHWEISDQVLAIVDGVVSALFFVEWIYWIAIDPYGYLFSSMSLVDLLSWVPGAVHISLWFALEYDEEYYQLWDWLRLLCLIRLLKTERYVGAFREMADILYKQTAILKGTGYIAFLLLLIFSTIFYYTECHNPDEDMNEYFGSSARTVWAMLINLHGEWVWCDYSAIGKAFGTILDLTAIGICMVPIVIFSEAYQQRLEKNSEGSLVKKPWQAACRPLDDGGAQVKLYDTFYSHNHVHEKFLSIGFIIVRSCSVFFVLLSAVSTVATNLERFKDDELRKSKDAMLDTFNVLLYVADIMCAVWFTVELILRALALHGMHFLSFVGFCDVVSLVALVVSIVPDLRNDVMHPGYKSETILPDMVVILRLLRLFVLESYIPVMHTLFNVVWANRYAMLRSLYALMVVWYWFASLLYMCERELPAGPEETNHHLEFLSGKPAEDDEEAENNGPRMRDRYRCVLSGLQYALVHMTGDYPIVEYILQSKFVHFFGCQIGMIVIAAFNGILTAGFVNYLEEERMVTRRKEAQERIETALVCVYVLQFRFRRMRKARMAKIAGLRNTQDAGPARKEHPFRFIRELTHRQRTSGIIFMGVCNSALIINVINTMLCSIDEIEDSVGEVLSIIEIVTTVIFVVEYVFRLLSYPRPCMNLLRPLRILDLICLLPSIGFFVHQTHLHYYRSGREEEFWESMLEFARVLRVIRIIDFPCFKRESRKTWRTLSDVSYVLAVPSVLALQVWMISASVFVFVEKKYDGYEAESMGVVGDALYWTSIFIIGEWANVDFSPGAGSRVCMFYCLVGICMFAIPVGLTIESVQSTLEEIQEERKQLASLYKIGKEGAVDTGWQGQSWGPMGYNMQPGYYDPGTVIGPGYGYPMGPGPEYYQAPQSQGQPYGDYGMQMGGQPYDSPPPGPPGGPLPPRGPQPPGPPALPSQDQPHMGLMPPRDDGRSKVARPPPPEPLYIPRPKGPLPPGPNSPPEPREPEIRRPSALPPPDGGQITVGGSSHQPQSFNQPQSYGLTAMNANAPPPPGAYAGGVSQPFESYPGHHTSLGQDPYGAHDPHGYGQAHDAYAQQHDPYVQSQGSRFGPHGGVPPGSYGMPSHGYPPQHVYPPPHGPPSGQYGPPHGHHHPQSGYY